MADLKTKFSIGEKVHFAGTHMVQKKHPCPDCKGSRKWQAESPAGGKYEFSCPRCSERYLSEQSLSLAYSQFDPYSRELTIGSVRVDTADDKPIVYMCVETGVGSGSIYREDDLFASEDEAMKAAKIKADLQNATNSWVVKQFDKTLSLSDYQLENALIKMTKDTKYRHEAKLGMLFDDLRDCETIEDVKRVLEGFSLRDAA